jgi:hypothetical protein
MSLATAVATNATFLTLDKKPRRLAEQAIGAHGARP